MTSGLERREVRALAHLLLDPEVASQATAFAAIVRQKIFDYGAPTTAELAGIRPHS